MKQMAIIILFVISATFADSQNKDVNHMIVKYTGETLVGSVDSIGQEFVYFVQQDSVDTDSIFLRDLYYIYNDFDRIFHTSWSFDQNIKRMSHRAGKLYTLQGDTIPFIKIEFNMDRINPEVFIKTGLSESQFVPLLTIEKIVTDKSTLHYSVERGFVYSFYSFLIASTLEVGFKWDGDRRASPQIWDHYNDLLPKATWFGLKKSGVTYESFIFLVPLSVLSSITYDLWKKKNEFYFSPVYEEKEFGRNMYLFSLKQIAKTYSKRLIFRFEKTSIGKKLFILFRKKRL